MKTTKDFKRFVATMILWIFTVSTINPVPALASGKSNKILYPLQEISTLECRFKDFDELTSDCKQDLPILKPKDYVKYSKQGGGYNDYTRLYTVLWGASYKYGWDVWNGGHMWVDIATAKWTPVYSIADGTVIIAKDLWMLGLTVSVEHVIDGKKIVSNYSHMSKISVKKWDKIKAGKKVWEVWNTGNSTWNHLHFQIDLDTPFHPSYYDYKTCPYSYNDISEKWVCFDYLQTLTIDPLDFIESQWGVLNNIVINKTSNTNNNSSNTVQNSNGIDMSVFDRTVYTWYSSQDIRIVQQIFKDLWYYKWAINWEYSDIEQDIIKYQLDKNVIQSSTENGAGWFGPKTRAQTLKDYNKYLAQNWDSDNTNSNTTTTITNNNNSIQKIDKRDLMTREQIEAKEVEEFIRKYNINLEFDTAGDNIAVGKTKILKLEITDKRGRAFKWNMPSGMTFVIDEKKATVFPTKLYYFTDGKRDIRITWTWVGDTRLYIKVGEKVIKTFNLKIYQQWKIIYPESSQIYSNSKVVLWETQTGLAVFKDASKNNLINIEYGSTFKLKASWDNKVCIKSGSIKNIKQIYKSECREKEYKNEIDFTYADTVWGILIYDYKVSSKNLTIDISNNYNNEVMAKKSLTVNNPKWLQAQYAYKNEVIDMLEKWIVDGINKWYFLEDRELKQYDAYTWIENSLENLNNQTLTSGARQNLQENLAQIRKEKVNTSRYNTISREELLKLWYDYLVLNKWVHNSSDRKYIDLESEENIQANTIFANNITWKDQFWEKYFRPDVKVTRWEAAFFIATAMDQSYQRYVTYK